MATEIIRQGAAPIRGRVGPVRSKALDRLRAWGAKGMRMAQGIHRELAEDLSGSDGDDTRVDGRRVKAPVWLFIACILGAAEVGRLEERLSTMSERQAEQKASFSASLARAQEEERQTSADLRRAVDQELADLRRLETENQLILQNLREQLIKRRVL